MAAQSLHHLVVTGLQQFSAHRLAVQSQLNLPVNPPGRVVAQDGHHVQVVPHRRVKLHAVEAEGPVAGEVDHPRFRVGDLGGQGVGQRRTQHAQGGHVKPALGHLRGQQGAAKVAVVAAVEGQDVVRAQHRLHRFVDVHRVHRRLGHRQTIGPLGLRGAAGPHVLQPGQVLPGVLGGLLGNLLQHAGDIAHHAHINAPVAANLSGGRVYLDDLGVGGNVGWPAKPDGVVLLAAQQNHQVGVAHLGGSPVETSLEEAETVGVVVAHQTPGLTLGEHRDAGGLGEFLQHFAGLNVSGGVTGDGKGAFGFSHQRHRLLH